jgi:hypothetical protein
MRRAVHVLLLAVVLGQAAGVFWLVGGDACADPCEDDDQGKECPPICPTCACSPRPSPTVPVRQAVLALPLPLIRLVPFAEHDRIPPTPEPHEILHVPKSLAA